MSERSKDIFIFTTAFRPFIGGSEIAIEEVIKRLNEYHFFIFTPRLKPNLPKHERRQNYDIYRVGFGLNLDKYIFPLAGSLAAWRRLRKNPARLLHAFQASQGAGAAWFLKLFKPRLPFILTLQEGQNLDKQSFFVKFTRSLIIRRADIITGISSYLLNYARQFNKKSKTILIPNGVSDNFLNQTQSSDNSGPVIITVSRLVRKNGVDLALKAFKEFYVKYSTASFVIIGTGQEEKYLKQLADELGISGAVKWLRGVENKLISHYLSKADIFIRLSRSEGLGTAFLEAMACGLPVIGTPVGGISDFLEHKKTGLLVPAENYQMAAEMMSLLIIDCNLKAELVENAKLMVKDHYTWGKIAEQYKKIYESR